MVTPEEIFVGSSEMGALMRSLDWSQTPLGALETWSQRLRTSISICLSSRFPILLWWGPDLVMFYNDAYRPILGAKHPKSMGQPGRDCWVEIWDAIGPMLEGVLNTGEATWSENQLLLLDRHGYIEECYFTFSYSPIADETGGIGGVFTAVTETTRQVIGERRLQTLRDLAANTARAKTLEEAYQAAIAALANNANCLPFVLLYRIAPDDRARLVGMTGLDAGTMASPEVADLDRAQVWPFKQAKSTGQPQRIENLRARLGELFDNNGATIANEAILLPLTQAGDKQRVIGFLVLGVSPKLAFDPDYQSFFNLVTGNVEMAIAKVEAYEAECQRAEALAELDRAKTTFFSNVSHEFRTPLALILSPLEELSNMLDGKLQPNEREQLQLIQRNGLRLQKLVNTLLDFSRIEAGRIQASYEPTDLAAYTAELASTFRSAIERAGMNLAIDCPALPEPVYVDRDMWEKIVLNLLSNAVKFTFVGRIVVRLQPVGSSIELSVTDTGVGIPEAELPRLFERFHRVSGTRSRTYEGSGIGLALVQELVKLHGGTIHVTSQVDRGTTFTIVIPFGTAHLPRDQIRATRTLASTALEANSYVAEASHWISDPPIEGSESRDAELSMAVPTQSKQSAPPPARILLVDDSTDMRDYVKRLLSQYWEVETVSDGLAALEAIAQRRPDLVLSDVMMPGLDGFGLLRELRANPLTKEILIILLSARSGEESCIEGLETGADDYLIKPFSARELLARVESKLKLAQIRQQAETTIREREERLKLAVKAGRMIVWEWKPFTETIISTNLAEICGIDTIELSRQGFTFIHPDDRTQHQAIVENAVAAASNYQSEFRFIRPDNGAIVWMEERGKPVLNEDGSLQKMIGVTIDITERKRAEIALQARSAELRHVTEMAGIGLTRCSRDLRYLSANSAYARLAGMSVEEIVGRPIVEMMGESAFEAIRPYVDRVLQGERVEYEAQVPFAAGGMRDLYVVYTPDKDSNGNIIGWIASVIDISDRKQIEADLRESEERYRYLVDVVPQHVWTADARGCNTYANQQMYDYIGVPAAQAMTVNWRTVLHPDDVERIYRRWMESLQTGIPYEAECRLRRADGVYRWHFARAIPFRDGNGQIVQWFGVSIDIHDKQELEQQRLQLLHQAQTASEEAERANRIKDEFLAVLSHELRSPLNPILGWSRLLLNGKLDESRTKYALATIERNAKLQSELIEDLLDVSRILRGKLSLTVNLVNLASIIRAAIETVRLAAEAKSIAIETELDPALGLVSGDPTRLQQVVWNLLSNAVKFTPSGGQVTVQLERVNDRAQITVRDNGKGISVDFLPYVFDYFRQADSATTRQFGGLGLGLAIVRHLVELHGGTVSVASPGEGQGATFTVRIPLMSPPSKDNQDALSPQRGLDLNGIKILIVDDEPDARELMAFILKQQGAQVIAATSACEALLILPQAKPDILLSDIGMPEMDGYMLIQQVRQLAPKQGGQIPAIALTAYAGDMNQQQALAAGFQNHISKPVEPEKLIHLISSLIKA